jgi:protein-tyrosine phosphatase
MSYALVFGVLGGALVYLTFGLGLPGLLVGWLGLSFLVVASGYAGLGPRVFGKQPDGSLGTRGWILLLPYLALIEGLWRLQRLFSRAPMCQEVAPGLWLGRRPLAGELPPEVRLVVDLTCEFPASRRPEGVAYISLPCLDGVSPEASAFTAAVDRMAGSAEPVYVHCALGHGRSATFAAAVLIGRGLAGSAEEAERLLARARPGVKLSPGQRRLLNAYCQTTGTRLPFAVTPADD